MANKDFLLKVAAVLEATAAHIDEIETAKTASATAEKQAIISSLATRYTETTGEDMPDSIKEKLASSDGDIVSLMTKMLEKQAGDVESLGAPSSLRDDNALPTTRKEASEQADGAFLNWIIS